MWWTAGSHDRVGGWLLFMKQELLRTNSDESVLGGRLGDRSASDCDMSSIFEAMIIGSVGWLADV